jgi:hypothetical protein
MARVEIVVQDVPVDLRAALVADAADRNISINETAVAILAATYGVPREPSTRPHRGESGSTQLLLTVPDSLRTAVRLHAARTGATMRGVVIKSLSDHYEIEAPDTGRRQRSPSTA